MMTSILLVDVQGLEARTGGGLSPADLLTELTQTMHGINRQIMVQRAYCSARISAYRRNAYRDAGYQIVETAGPDETLIMMTLDLADLSGGNAVYEEAVILGGTTDYTALARLAHENLMMISVMDHPTIPTSLEALADRLIDPDELPVSDAPSILDRADDKRADSKLHNSKLDETPGKSPFLAPLPKSSILAKEPDEPAAEKAADPTDDGKSSDDNKVDTPADSTAAPAVPAEASTKQDADIREEEANESDTPAQPETDKGDPWPNPKTGPILVAGGSIAETLGVATALDDPEPANSAEPFAAAEPTDPIEAELAADIDEELSLSAEDIGDGESQSETTDSIDLQIEDLVADQFTESSSDTPSDALAGSVDTEKSTDEPDKGDDPLDALFADLGTDLAPAPTEVASGESSVDPLDSLDINPEDLLEDLEPLEPIAELSPVAPEGSVADEAQPAPDTAEKSPSQELSEEVDELLSRLMSDGPSEASAEDLKLDVVPER